MTITYYFRCLTCGSEDIGDKDDVREFKREHPTPNHEVLLVSADEDE